ncbi:hypothetical protein H0I76_19065 [Limibaculum sp. M0105]|uniref:Uncharacterized protein n=1 Tax=Thermohalobaculum xanthum TaxID=2753746 RepID=A0A8J7MBT2_9RHOB|nr:hypothetical protein [Thermohalobaculum xanthum]MBK0401304.1 hypothetical protein [Thermohalobaculum xanthum]
MPELTSLWANAVPSVSMALHSIVTVRREEMCSGPAVCVLVGAKLRKAQIRAVGGVTIGSTIPNHGGA